jgi:phytoene/squalene synthetase
VPSVLAAAALCSTAVQADCLSLLDTVRRSKTFQPIIRMLPGPGAARRVDQLYGLFRLMDDLVDEAPGGAEGYRLAESYAMRVMNSRLDPDPGIAVVQSCNIPHMVWQLFLEGLHFDAFRAEGYAAPDLDWYSLRVAGVVGIAWAFAAAPEGTIHSESELLAYALLGKALQRFNIVRDFHRDAKGAYLTSPAHAAQERLKGSLEMRDALKRIWRDSMMPFRTLLLLEAAAHAYEAMAYSRSRRLAGSLAVARRVAQICTPFLLPVCGVLCIILALAWLVVRSRCKSNGKPLTIVS